MGMARASRANAMRAGETALQMCIRHMPEQEARIARQIVLVERLRESQGALLGNAFRLLDEMHDLLATMREHAARLSDSGATEPAGALWCRGRYCGMDADDPALSWNSDRPWSEIDDNDLAWYLNDRQSLTEIADFFAARGKRLRRGSTRLGCGGRPADGRR